MGSLPDHAINQAVDVLLEHFQPFVTTNTKYHVQEERNMFLEPAAWEKPDRDANRLELVLQVFHDRVTRRVKELRRSRNSVVSIHRLPPEILAEIFTLISHQWDLDTVDQDIAKQHAQNIYKSNATLSRVCSRWHSVALSTPRLWVNLHVSFNLNLVETLLQRSKQSPLHIAISSGGGLLDREFQFMQLVHQHITRWRSFQSWSSFTGFASFEYVANHPAPLIEKFSVLCQDTIRHGTAQLSRFFDDQAPKLRSLNIVPLDGFPLSSIVLSGITSLRFTAEFQRAPFTIDHFHTLFSSSPNLEDVYINSWSPASQGIQTITTFDISLPYLRIIHLHNLPDITVGSLISSISVNPKSYPFLKITENLHPGRLHEMFPVSPKSDSLLDLIRSMTWLSTTDEEDPNQGRFINILAGAHSDVGRRELLHFAGAVDGPASAMFETLLQPGTRSGLKDIRIIGEELFETNSFIGNLRFYSNVEVLKLWRGDGAELGQEDRLDLVDFLSEEVAGCLQSMSSDGLPSWPCPKLKYLSLGGAIHIRPILEIVQARFSNAGPTTLRALEIGYFADTNSINTQLGIVEQLKELLTGKNAQLFLTEIDFDYPLYKRLELPSEASVLKLS